MLINSCNGVKERQQFHLDEGIFKFAFFLSRGLKVKRKKKEKEANAVIVLLGPPSFNDLL